MGAAYTILGKQVPAHILSIATLSAVAAGTTWSLMGPKTEAKAAPVAPVSQSKEEDFDFEKIFNDLTKEEAK
ncbi:uncharacterized protein SPAPADRAFT_60813 [Spathaspora passalidarum NRRL Y-27907]|uniref:ATP synthase subunit K, mitochondrial n=1 Tax=Spathaspora passalidarum (strain NRRL Y-27907 / 11-Y1) TaxID=619300 RepID=G3AML6_SPAPN|nr:uncharacterized protein SPAPADRAFT_60813 [Spathaspora passalidarum NRRL Y-27907]EGW33460.1 hypothetical protein SPAPADRAFT_60813 [Spathaspora passalidarum NRRL Y-27907]